MPTGEVYYSSDWHLGHQRIIELCDRPFGSVQEMNREILERCNDTVKEGDFLYLLGDLVMGKYTENVELLRQIRCKHVQLVPGNHDRWSLAYRNSPAKRVEVLTQLRSFPGVYPLVDREPSVWDHTTAAGRQVLMSHYPYEGDSHGDDRYTHLRPPEDEQLPLIHGHVHEKWKTNGRQLNVGVDVWDFTPVSSEEVDTWIDSLYKGTST